MNTTGIWKHVLGYLLILAPWIVLLTQAQLNWLTFANEASGRYFGIGMVILSSIGVSVLTTPAANQLKFGLIALISQLGLLFIGGSFGIMDAGTVDYTTTQGIYYALDGISGFATAVSGIAGLVGVIAKAIPVVVLIIGVIGILAADSPDEYVTPMIETGIAIVLIAVFWGLGSWIGFV